MTHKEFKRLSRSQLIDIIYQLQLKQNELEEENRKLKAEVGDKRIRLREAGNIAEAALAMHNVMQSAQDAANQYLEEIRAMKKETAENCNRILEKAKQEAAAIVARANQKHTVYDSAVDAILKEYQQEK